jgi:hypothetical protein
MSAGDSARSQASGNCASRFLACSLVVRTVFDYMHDMLRADLLHHLTNFLQKISTTFNYLPKHPQCLIVNKHRFRGYRLEVV